MCTLARSKCQNPIQAQDAKIAECIDADLNGKGGIFQALSEKKWKTTENVRKRKKPSHENSETKSLEKCNIFDMFLHVTCIL